MERTLLQEICKRIEENSDPSSDLLSACDLYYNASGNSECFDIYEEYIYCADPTGCTTGPVSTAWDYQVISFGTFKLKKYLSHKM